jgi:YD repeat-containing protein
MPLESATYINGLDANNPTGSDTKAAGDDHLRLIKGAIKASFPSVAGSVTASHSELSYCAGVTSAIQTQIDSKAPSASPSLTGSPTAPTQPSGDNSTKIATTAYVDQRAFSTALPIQATNNGKAIRTNGTTAFWASDSASSQTMAYNGNGQLTGITETVDGYSKSTTYTYNADGTVNTETVTWHGVTRIRTHNYTNGQWTGSTEV